MYKTNIIPLLNGAKFLECENAMEIVSRKLLHKNVNSKNLLLYYSISKIFKMKSLQVFILNTLLQRYLTEEDVASFCNLNFDDVCRIFLSSELQISSELQLFNAAAEWILFKRFERSEYMSQLLKLIRLPLLSNEILTDIVQTHELCSECNKCKTIIVNAISYKNVCKNKASDKQFQNRHYSCCLENNKIFSVGGVRLLGRFGYKDLDYKQTATYYKFHNNFFFPTKTTEEMHMPRGSCEIAVIGTKVYCYYGDALKHDTLEIYCRKDKIWSSLNLPVSSLGTCICSFTNKLYFFGGMWDPRSRFGYEETVCLVHDPNWPTGQLDTVSRMNAGRYYASCAVFHGQCVVLGGRSRWENGALKSVECYDPHTDKWSSLSDMRAGRHSAGVVARGNKLYVLGGKNRNDYCDFLEVYDSVSGKFTNLAAMKISCPWSSCRPNPVVFGDRIVVFLDGYISCYDIKKNKVLRYKNVYKTLEFVHNTLVIGVADCSYTMLHKILK